MSTGLKTICVMFVLSWCCEALAADRWTGPYIGGNMGFGWSKIDSAGSLAPPAIPGVVGIAGFSSPEVPITPPMLIGSDKHREITFGGQVGYNWQGAGSTPWVIGIEADLQSLRGSSTAMQRHRFRARQTLSRVS